MPELVLYDISSPLQPRSYAPNPSKARLALGFKGANFRTEWVDIIDISKVRQGLNCAATRKLDDGSDYYTLPMLQDPSTGLVIGDSFAIAVHLDKAYPDKKPLLPSEDQLKGRWQTYESPSKDTPFYAPITTNVDSTHQAFARFNLHVDATFSAHMILYAQFLPFNPDTADATKALMSKRAHLSCWEDLSVPAGLTRVTLLDKFEKDLESLAALFGDEGKWLEGGDEVCYADIIVGGWLNMLSHVMPEDEWKALRGWYGGVFGRVHDVLQERYFVV